MLAVALSVALAGCSGGPGAPTGSASVSVAPAPRDPDASTARIVFVADTNWNANTQAVMDAMGRESADVVQINGDLSYGAISEADYSREVKARLGAKPVEVVPGNHEATNPAYYGTHVSDMAKYDLPDGMHARPLPGALASNGYPWNYSYDVDGVRVIVTSPNLYFSGTTGVLTYGAGTPEVAAFKAAVADARARGLWVISAHHESYFDPGQHMADPGNTGPQALAQAEIDAHVDLVMAGHSTNYARSNQVSGPVHSPIAAAVADADGTYARDRGTVFMITGTGGDPAQAAKARTSDAWPVIRDTRTDPDGFYGYGSLTADARTMTVQFRTATGAHAGAVSDRFTISR